MTTRAAIYCRISRDRVGAGLGVGRQAEDCQELAGRLGVTVVKVYEDNDLSAYSGKPRPAYLRLLDDVRDGAIDTVLVWHTDRLHRSPAELETWIDACQSRGVAVHSVQAGPFDLATPSGRAVARTLGVWARYEVEHSTERKKRAKAQAAAAGRWRGGRRPFGFEPDGITVRPVEAVIVAEATDRVLAGETLHGVAPARNPRGGVTSRGGTWRSTEVRRLLLRARNAGLIEHDGREIGPALWKPIVEPATWRSVCRLLNADGRRPPRAHDVRWLGSGLYLCGVCDNGETMISASAQSGSGRGGRRIPSYRCRTGVHLTRAAAPLDEFIADLVIETLSLPDAHLLLAPETAVQDVAALHVRRADVEARLAELAGLFADGAVTGPQLAEGTRKLRAEGDRLDSEIAASVGRSPLAGFADAVDVREAWEAASIPRRKAVVNELMTVTLLKASRGRPAGWKPGESYFNRDAVRIERRRSAVA